MPTLKKSEIVRDKTEIEKLFQQSKRISTPLIQLFYTKTIEQQQLKILFVVSKKKIPQATKRNRVKRLLREVWRQEKDSLQQQNMVFALVYQSNKVSTLEVIRRQLHELLKQFYLKKTI